MAEVIALSLAVLAAIFIGYPLYQSRNRQVAFDLNHKLEDFEARKTEIYAAIKDIDFDYQMGKLSDEDYQEMRQKYKAEAVELLKRTDAMRRGRSKRRKSKGVKAGMSFCSNCGASIGKNDRFCSECGSKVQ